MPSGSDRFCSCFNAPYEVEPRCPTHGQDPRCDYCNLRLSEHEVITPWCEGQALALPRRREKLRRAAEDGERLYRVRMHAPDGPTIADDNRIDGILSLELLDALGLVDQLVAVAQAASLVAAYHQAGGNEWWDAHSRLYRALNDLGVETPYASVTAQLPHCASGS